MSKRSQEKRISHKTRTLKFLRAQAGMSLYQAAKVSGLKYGIISHLENGRAGIHERHLDKLLVAYKVTRSTFEMFANGKVELPKNLKAECIELIHQMNDAQLRTVHPVLLSLSKS